MYLIFRQDFLDYWYIVLLPAAFLMNRLSLYGGFQIGMLPVTDTSAYWYFAAILVISFVILVGFRNRFTPAYFSAALFLLFMGIGQSMYFFGRSHENNIINISGILLFITMLCCDMLLTLNKPENEFLNEIRGITGLLPAIIIFLVYITNDVYLFNNSSTAFSDTLKKGKWTYTESEPPNGSFESIQRLTGDSRKLYFMTYYTYDFYLYYRGNYEIPAKFTPVDSWIILDDKIAFANDLLNKGYYIIAFNNDAKFNQAILPRLHYNKINADGRYIALAKK